MYQQQAPGRENTGQMRDRIRQEQAKQYKKKLGRKITWYVTWLFIAEILFAQVTVWALSDYHVHSGLIPPLVLMNAFGTIVGASVRIGMMGAVRGIQD